MKLEVRGVSKSFEDKAILDDISIELKDGELVCLLGTSGAGKTTLFHIISGVLEPDEGQVLLNGKEITNSPGKVSYMLQKDMLLPYKTVLDSVALPLRLRGISRKKAREEASSYFREFGIDGYQKKYPNQMSGGMRQRAALLRTYLFSGEVALLDEPFSALDTMTKSKMHEWYLSIMDQIKLSTLFITHDIDEAILLSDRIYILTGKPGRIQEEIVISPKRPRFSSFVVSDEFLRYKKQILAVLQEER